MQACGKEIICWDYLRRPCLRQQGHTPNLCNPFSPEHPLDKPNIVKSTEELYRQVLAAAGLNKEKLSA